MGTNKQTLNENDPSSSVSSPARLNQHLAPFNSSEVKASMGGRVHSSRRPPCNVNSLCSQPFPPLPLSRRWESSESERHEKRPQSTRTTSFRSISTECVLCWGMCVCALKIVTT
ncbi:hypothetical protein ElyMa_002001000 [Elysia marginata]|uniref:Uncharacterized protein n=1 Tax=Elysia marginata TaxID=1093978 RepID=A0AAV4F458_9GAST|nr:hypothetical protein ElyMa_002001000 [Elysia marginata]